MNEKLQKTAQNLLASDEVDMVIGYAEGSEGNVRAHFASSADSAKEFIFDDRCIQNLAVYLVKTEVKKIGKIAVFATLPTIRSILQVASENQLKEDNLVVLGMTDPENIPERRTFKEMEAYVAGLDLNLTDSDKELIEKLEGMDRDERWQFWLDQFSKCIKCYACRASCPMCYCGRCQADYNQPQLISIEATPLGNLEWHTLRAMHLAGRCVTCGDCGRACPVGIPIHLLTIRMAQAVKDSFNVDAGKDSQMISALSTYEKDDKEEFIQHE